MSKSIKFCIFSAVFAIALFSFSSCKKEDKPEKHVVVGAQIGELTAGIPGEVYFPVRTEVIADGDLDVVLFIPPLSEPVLNGVTVKGKVKFVNNIGTLTLVGDASTQAGTYTWIALIVDGVSSAPFTLTIK